MEEELDDISSLVEKYEQILAFSRKIYFDADEFAALLITTAWVKRTGSGSSMRASGCASQPDLMISKAKTMVYAEV